MTGIGRGKGRGGTGRGRGNSGATYPPQLQLRGNTRASRETGYSNNPCQDPIEKGQISSNPLHRPSLETVYQEILTEVCILLQKLKMVVQSFYSVSKSEWTSDSKSA